MSNQFFLGLTVAIFSALPLITSAQNLTLQRLNADLNQPVFATFAPNASNRLYVIEKEGAIRIVNRTSGAVLTNDFMTVPNVESSGDERGLSGLAFHPDFANNGYFYVNFTDTSGSDTQVVRFTADSIHSADPSTAFKIIEIDQPQSTHNGGWIAFGDDGYLYVSVGDGGSSNDNGTGHTPGIGNSQDTTNNLLGTILRIDVDNDDFPSNAQRNYAIPSDNPFVGTPGDNEIYVYGLRNPWRCSFDRDTDDLYIADVGQGTREEVTMIPAGSGGGYNLGWRLREGTIETPGSVGGPAPADAIDPIYDYEHGNGDFEGQSVTGGYVYRGPIESLQGRYFFGDYISGNLWSLTHDGSPPEVNDGGNFNDLVHWQTSSSNGGSAANFSSFGEDFFGNLYILDFNGGEIFRIEDATVGPANGQFGGNVEVSVNNGDLRVTGENSTDQCIIVSATNVPGRFVFSSVAEDGAASTTFNGQNPLVVNGVTDDMRFDIKSGRKVLILTESLAANFVVPDDLRITGTGEDDVIVILDSVTVGGRSDVKTRSGDDAILIHNSSFSERLRVTTANGNDVLFDGWDSAPNVYDEDLDISMGSGEDDTVCLGSMVQDDFRIRLGSGNDATAIEDCFLGTTRIYGNGDFDTYASRDNVIASLLLRHFEQEITNTPAIINQAQQHPTFQEAEMFFTILGLGE